MGEKMDDMKGKTKEAVGDATGNESLEREGKVDQGVSGVKEKLTNAADAIGDKVKDANR